MSRNRGSRGAEALRDAFSAANLRAMLGIVDTGRVLLGRLAASRGEPLVEHDGKDLLVRVVDVLTNHPLLARLHVPANMLWRKPKAGETMAVVVPANIDHPGGPVALYGDAGGDGAVPSWVDTKSGLFAPETVRVESADHDVEIEADGQIKLGAGATKKVARENDSVRVTIPSGTTFTGTIAGSPVTFTTNAPVTCNGTITSGSDKVRAED